MTQGCGADCGCMPQILKSLPSSASMQPCHWERPHHSLPQASVAPSVFQVLCGENSCSVLYFVLKKEKKKSGWIWKLVVRAVEQRLYIADLC